ncbi:MAG: dehydratase [Chloroflexi bacterium]|jgi:acyl dehydratase|nr:dehydratase [Chloroflexota bacterium]|tara:strand:- start:289 stop:708 length:420 start_codon:yes stop_codon:yes gene_type:complete
MNQNLYFEDIKIGMEIPTIKKNPTTQQLVKYAGASGDFYQIHYDMDYAKNNGLPGVILHGALKNAFLGQVITDWIGNSGKLKMLEVQYKGMDLPGTPVYAKGIVTDIIDENNINCDLWLETDKGDKTTVGKAIIQLPKK